MNLSAGVWKYRYRRLRELSLNDLAVRLGIRLWRKKILGFIKDESGPVTNQNIDKWINLQITSEEFSKLEPEHFEAGIRDALPEGYFVDDNFWETFSKLYPQETSKLLKLALDVVEGRIELFGWKTSSVSIPELVFSNDIFKNDGWDSSYYWDINYYHDSADPNADVKWLWELQRFQFLLWLGGAWKLTGDARFPDTAQEILDSWMHDLEYPFGVQWSSNLEVGLRLLSVSRCYILCMDSPSWDSRFRSRLIKWLFLLASHVKEEMTLHHPAGNHPLGEASALLWFSLLIPDLTVSNSWKKHAYTVIDGMFPKLVFPDGVYAEQSTGYLKFVLEFMIPNIFLDCSMNGGFSPLTLERVESSLRFIGQLSDHGKHVPMIGDADSGSAIGWRLDGYWDFSWLLAAGATLLNLPELALGINDLPAEAYLNVGCKNLYKFDSFNQKAARSFSAFGKRHTYQSEFRFGGYHVSNDSRFRIIFDCGPLGIYPGFGHGHADALSVLISLKNKPLIVDTGTMHYNAEPVIRSFFRNTQSHNTLCVDNKSQAQPLDTFKWESNYNIWWNDSLDKGAYRVFSGILQTGWYVHKRIIIHIIEKGLIIKDRLQWDGTKSVENFFHFAPGAKILGLSRNWFTALLDNEVVEIGFSGSRPVFAQVIRGSKDPLMGWYSENYGEMIPTNSIRCCGSGIGHFELQTVVKSPEVSLSVSEEFVDF
jgi:hypothetical protein